MLLFDRMRIPTGILPSLVALATGVRLVAAALPPGSAELIWQDDPAARARLALEADPPPSGSQWPKSVEEVCAAAWNGSSADSPARVALRHACGAYSGPPAPVAATLHAGLHGIGKAEPLGSTFEDFGSGWRSLRTDPEMARAWNDLPPAARLDLRHAFSATAFTRVRLGLRKDMAAWRSEDLSSNLPLAAGDVDINEPSLGYFHYEGASVSATFGRFPIHWSPSPDFGLALSRATPYHNGAGFSWRMHRLTYRFLVSSLNPWLQGTPPGDSAGTAYPVGSEEWRQRNYPDAGPASNAHRRVYDDRIKTLLAHRAEIRLGRAVLGFTESQVIGGKVPDLRDLNPFAIFHNDFRDGYSNNNASLDASLPLGAGFSAAGELFLDDLRYGSTEEDRDGSTRLGWLGSVRHSFAAGGLAWSQSLHLVRTDPFLYGMPQPLNTHYSRHILSTNRSDQSDPGFYDKIVADHPIGYARGADAFDLWYRLEAFRGRAAGTFGAALLSKGEAGAEAPFERSWLPHGSSPSGVAEEELRLSLEGRADLGKGMGVGAGAVLSLYRNRHHAEGAEDRAVRGSIGFTWAYPR